MRLTTKVLLNTVRQKNDGTYPLTIRVTIDGRLIYIPLGLNMTPKDFDEKNQRIKPSTKRFNNVVRMNHEIASEVKRVYDEVYKLSETVDISKISMKAVKQFIMGQAPTQNKPQVFQYYRQVITELRAANKIGNSNVYSDSMKAWQRFRAGTVKRYNPEEDLDFETIDLNMLKAFEAYYRRNGKKPNAIGVYLRTFRALWNRANKDGIVDKNNYPFENYTIPTNTTQKRALSLDHIEHIKSYQTETGSALWHAKNFFLFSFYCRGINFIDMAFLKLFNIENGRINYTRRKTGADFSIKITAAVQEILDIYTIGKASDDFVFPIITQEEDEAKMYAQIKSYLQNHNKRLKIIAKDLGLPPISTYMARHSYATGLYTKGVSSEIIKESLGHTDVSITETYLKSFGNAIVDEADELLA